MRPQGPWEKRRKLQLEGWHEVVGIALKFWKLQLEGCHEVTGAVIKIREIATRRLP